MHYLWITSLIAVVYAVMYGGGGGRDRTIDMPISTEGSGMPTMGLVLCM